MEMIELIFSSIIHPVYLTLKEETYEKVTEIGKNNDYLGFEYFSKHYELIAIDFSKHIKLEKPDL